MVSNLQITSVLGGNEYQKARLQAIADLISEEKIGEIMKLVNAKKQK